jgi:serine/threonine protein kinase
MILITPSYMPHEQAIGDVTKIGPAAVIFALGAILYELLTGRPPFRTASVIDTLRQVDSVDAVQPARLNPQVPRDLETVCLKCLRTDRAKRYATAAELADDLRRFQAGEPVRARPAGARARVLTWARQR